MSSAPPFHRLNPAAIEALACPLLLARVPGLQAVYLYGSHGAGVAGPASDVDLAVLVDPAAPPPDLYALSGDLRWALGCDIALVDLGRTSTVLQKEVVATGMPLYQRDADRQLVWEAEVLSRYGHLNEARAGILEDFARTGIGYAPQALHGGTR